MISLCFAALRASAGQMGERRKRKRRKAGGGAKKRRSVAVPQPNLLEDTKKLLGKVRVMAGAAVWVRENVLHWWCE